MRVDEVVARDDHPVLDEIRHWADRRSHRGPSSRPAGWPSSASSADIDWSTIRNVSLAGTASRPINPCESLDAGHLHQKAVDPLPFDDRLTEIEFIDAAADHRDRSLNCLVEAKFDAGVRQIEFEQARLGLFHGQFDDRRAGGAGTTNRQKPYRPIRHRRRLVWWRDWSAQADRRGPPLPSMSAASRMRTWTVWPLPARSIYPILPARSLVRIASTSRRGVP